MVSSRDSHIIELWLQRQASPHTRGCYQRDAARLLAHASKPLNRLTLGDLQSFAQSLVQAGLAHLAGPHPSGRQEPVWVLPANALRSRQSRRGVGAALL
jgi:hypothetical protein